jgi:phosphoenolpyruvate carboxykinase (GTP)
MGRTSNPHVLAWVERCAALAKPDRIEWCDGTEEEARQLTELAVREKVLLPLDPVKQPRSYLHRSNPNDVARVEQLTFICCPKPEDAGPTNNWLAPDEARERCERILDGAMRGRTMHVVPYLMGPKGSPFSKVGVQLTDSVYVVLNMRIMTRMGTVAWEHLGDSDHFVRGLHSVADCSPERRYICHFPQDYAITSVGSGYGGNALLSKKCFALRIAGAMARREGWLAEHMLIMGLEDPQGEITWVCAAFPSACGKTNFAMMVPARKYREMGYKVHTIGDDIAWLRFGEDGRLWAMNPEAGFFGVVPGTNAKTNPNAMKMLEHDALFTNVALRKDGSAWWEGLDPPPEDEVLEDWQGRPWTASSKEKAAHPNARFTVPVRQCATFDERWDDLRGVPISAILFGSRRSELYPLVVESRDWAHGVYFGATLTSETTAAAVGKVGVVRRDPMAMIPFCGYNMGDYFAHWLDVGRRGGAKMPKVFRVNWFRKGPEGKFLWPGFGENVRVLRWIVERCRGRAKGSETPVGVLPPPGEIDVEGLDLAPGAMDTLSGIDRKGWREEAQDQEAFFSKFAGRIPRELEEERRRLLSALG